MRPATRLSFFAACPPGLESILQTELFNLGLNHPQAVPGGVEFSGFLSHLYRVNFWSRTASRVLVRVGEFDAKTFPELKRKAADLLWGQFLKPGSSIQVRATCHKSKLYHSDAVAERVVEAIQSQIGTISNFHAKRPTSNLQVVARLDRDHCTLSLDSSGDHLHLRGYRLATGKAPLRETLAAALLLYAHYDPTQPFLDPFCGSGTFAIEAALIARNLAPGLQRRFAFMDWINFAEADWTQLLIKARAESRGSAPAPILASDRDAGAVAAATENAARAGVADSIQIATHSLTATLREPPPNPGLIVTNLPYGQRVGADVRNVYAQFGNVLREKCAGWRVGFVAGSLALVKQTRLAVGEPVWIENGGLKVPFVQATL